MDEEIIKVNMKIKWNKYYMKICEMKHEVYLQVVIHL